jgi:hypothetical protein
MQGATKPEAKATPGGLNIKVPKKVPFLNAPSPARVE